MNGKVFVDTNVLVYAYDNAAGEKRQRAQVVLEELWRERTGALSMQVLQEFYVTVTRKLASPVSRAKAQLIAGQYAQWCIATGPEELAAAFAIEEGARIGFWDALIVAAAAKAGAGRILSEDLNSGQRIAGIPVENPFVA